MGHKNVELYSYFPSIRSPPPIHSLRNPILIFICKVAYYYYRPHLKKAALARLSDVNRSLKVTNFGVKKKNRQTLKIRGRD
ncbi:uncharacterized protein LOC118481890 isoform X2 [Helianthus annuus]|uniref:Uncharacterized protein n=2 Tax=Helianthus annuus TaxID=4232 RepID=A0A251U6A0_HELAN|nr:uncharacterized protein LOC118481890 isoform X2 [Helianthus annuus]